MIFQRFAVAFGLANQRNLSYERGDTEVWSDEDATKV